MAAFIHPVMTVSPATAARRAALHHPVTTALRSGYTLLTGVDEAGAGALAGPVVAAAVQLRSGAKSLDIPHLDDSKRLSPRRRQQVYDALVACNDASFTVNVCSARTVDQINVLNARMRAMTDAVQDLPIPPGLLFVDGDRSLEGLDCQQNTIIGGDARVSIVAAASVVAKVVRDHMMKEQASRFHQFSFDSHVGYGTKQHLLELREFGPCEIHRFSFKPVRLAANLHKKKSISEKP